MLTPVWKEFACTLYLTIAAGTEGLIMQTGQQFKAELAIEQAMEGPIAKALKQLIHTTPRLMRASLQRDSD
jgi:hypothetical protein